MSGETAGQMAYEAYRARIDAGDPWPLGGPGESEPWEVLGDDVTTWFDDMGQAAAAVETRQVRLAREDRDAVRGRMLALAAELEDKAAVSRYVALESVTLRETAAMIRKGLDV